MTTQEPSPRDTPGRRFSALVVEDFRSVRRWLVLLGVLAVAASAVALYSILRSEQSADSDRVDLLEQRLDDADRQLRGASEESDVRRLERRVRRAGEETDVQRLDRRLRRVERDVVDALDTSADAGRALRRVQSQIDSLKRRRRR